MRASWCQESSPEESMMTGKVSSQMRAMKLNLKRRCFFCTASVSCASFSPRRNAKTPVYARTMT
eukprot:CAMPEP_0117526418 /NCGR_PEP_ID=MMETSP0784-20121206/36275_1 /TAXON_ID=39447 /ORGANISM="" /LENGTH=63 /DNA_ID=CAMNT_0005322645 /DNA_START=204 /DNA_END=395 /DNA_ORIENTATION=+